MNTHKLVKWMHDEGMRAQGQSEIWERCSQDIDKSIRNDIAETKIMCECVPEPSDAERATWPDATSRYVENLEMIVDDMLTYKEGSGK